MVETTKYQTIEVSFEIEKRVEGIRFYSTGKELLYSSQIFPVKHKVDRLSKAIKLVSNGASHVTITLDGKYADSDRLHPIKRYTYEPIHAQCEGVSEIEHRPYKDNEYGIDSVTKHDTLTKLLNALCKDILTVVTDNLINID